MLFKLLNFPEEFKINRELKKDMFLQSANLTKAEKRELNKCLKRVRILYDLVFSDKSETIVLEVEIDCIINEYTMIDVAKHIAKSISYNTIIIVTHKSPTKTYLAKIFVFESRQNFKNHKRTRVLDVFESKSFILSLSRSLIQETVDRLRDLIPECQTSIEFQDKCIAVINPPEDGILFPSALDNQPAIPSDEDFIFTESYYKRRFENIYINSDSQPSYLSEKGGSAYADEQRYRKLFVDSCADYCYALYLELNPEILSDISVEKPKMYRWLSTYIDACNELAREHDLMCLSKPEIACILRRFRSGYEYKTQEDKDRLLYIEELLEVIQW